MDGVARAAERRFDRDLSLAWHTAAFSGSAQAGKLKSLSTYRQRKSSKQTPQEMLGTFRVLQDMGAPMSIRQVN
jgi:hypothetical protein